MLDAYSDEQLVGVMNVITELAGSVADPIDLEALLILNEIGGVLLQRQLAGGDSAAGDDTYPMPKHGWTCFHCGENFVNPNLARGHFGPTPSATPACVLRSERPLVYQLRDVEAERDELKIRLTIRRCGGDKVLEDDAAARFHALRGTERAAGPCDGNRAGQGGGR